MAQKRKMEVSVVDEIDKGLYTIFERTANHLSQLYNEATSQQRIAFDAGKKHTLATMCEWLDVKQQEGTTITAADIRAYLQNELNNCEDSAALQDHQGTKSHQSIACGKKQSAVVSSSSASAAQCHNNFQDMEMEATPEDLAP